MNRLRRVERAREFGLEVAGQKTTGRLAGRPMPARSIPRKSLARRRRPASPKANAAAQARRSPASGACAGRRRPALRRRPPAQVRRKVSRARRMVVLRPSPQDPGKPAAQAGRAPRRASARPSAPAWRQRAWREPRNRPATRLIAPASVATSCQFGSRVPSARANVHTSVTSTTASGLPSTTLPAASRVAVISLERKRTVICATRLLCDLDAGDLGLVDRHEGGLGFLAALLALGDRAFETFEDIPREKVLQGLAVALGEGGDDHLVGDLAPSMKAARIKAGLDARDLVEAAAPSREPGSATPRPAVRPPGRPSRRRSGRSRRGSRQAHDVVAVRARRCAAPRAARGAKTDRAGGCSLPGLLARAPTAAARSRRRRVREKSGS